MLCSWRVRKLVKIAQLRGINIEGRLAQKLVVEDNAEE
jgi:hypothetical protein